ncbi:hypothetical protein D3C73_1246930 [compost metagenome]
MLPPLSGRKRFFLKLIKERLLFVLGKFFVFIGGRIGERFLDFGFEFMRLTD